MTERVCGLCGHAISFETCGGAGVWNEAGPMIELCHADDHDCFHLWTVYGKRPPHGEE